MKCAKNEANRMDDWLRLNKKPDERRSKSWEESANNARGCNGGRERARSAGPTLSRTTGGVPQGKNSGKRTENRHKARGHLQGSSGSSCLCSHFDPEYADWLPIYYPYHPPRIRSYPNFFRSINDESGRELWKVKRSLRLLGFQLSDFGIHPHGDETTPRCKPRRRSPTYSTRTLCRSISLASLRETVREAWMDNCLDNSHRRLLAQAAYEEWYFKKERELWRKKEEEKKRKTTESQNSQRDTERKRVKAEEEFAKWLQKKRGKRKKENSTGRVESFCRLVKTKEEVEKAFLKWKKEKDRELEKIRRKKKVEEAEKAELEKQKNEKKAIAEKAFQQWKNKLEEIKKTEEENKIRRKKKLEEIERRRRKEQGTQISFQAWKANKDTELKARTNKIREATRQIEEDRLIQMEERMYEAEQAFQDWLEKVDLRKQKQFCKIQSFHKSIPWLPV